MWGRGFARTIGIVSLLAGSCLPGTQAVAQDATDHWLGWYAGGALGISWTDVDIAMLPNNFSESYDGISGGLVGGNNFYVTDEHLAGIEADITFADLSGGVTLARHKVSLLGRVGRFWSPSTLLFAVGGLAGGQYEAKVSTTETTTATTTNTVTTAVTQTRTEIIFDDQTESEIEVIIPFTTFITSTSTSTTITTSNRRCQTQQAVVGLYAGSGV